MIPYEVRSALGRRARDGTIRRQEMTRILSAFESDWLQVGKIRVDESVLRRAGKLCLKHAIRSADAIQLAAALVASEGQEEPFVFLTSDKRLEAAANREKIITSLP